MHFQYPLYFLLLSLLLLFPWLNRRLERWRRESAGRYADQNFLGWLLPQPSRGRLIFQQALWLMALAAVVAGLARPQGEPVAGELPKISRTLYAVLDCSLSMQAQDQPPSRFEAAKAVLGDLIRQLPEDRIGLIGFAGKARILCPATTDHETLGLSLEKVMAGVMEPAGSNPASGLELAVDKLKPQPGVRGIVFLTDGEGNQPGDFQAAAAAAAAAQIPVYGVGLGSEGGTRIPIALDEKGREMYRVHQGRIVISRRDSLSLRKAAKLTRGGYWDYDRHAAASLAGVINRQGREAAGKRVVWERPEYFPGFAAAGLLLLLLEWLWPVLPRKNPPEIQPGAGPGMPAGERSSEAVRR